MHSKVHLVQPVIHHSCQSSNFLFISMQILGTVEPYLYSIPSPSPLPSPKKKKKKKSVCRKTCLRAYVHFPQLNVYSSQNLFIVQHKKYINKRQLISLFLSGFSSSSSFSVRSCVPVDIGWLYISLIIQPLNRV